MVEPTRRDGHADVIVVLTHSPTTMNVHSLVFHDGGMKGAVRTGPNMPAQDLGVIVSKD